MEIFMLSTRDAPCMDQLAILPAGEFQVVFASRVSGKYKNTYGQVVYMCKEQCMAVGKPSCPANYQTLQTLSRGI
jgi:hypothetical protein